MIVPSDLGRVGSAVSYPQRELDERPRRTDDGEDEATARPQRLDHGEQRELGPESRMEEFRGGKLHVGAVCEEERRIAVDAGRVGESL